MIEARDSNSLQGLDSSGFSRLQLKRKLPDSMKWQAYYLGESALGLIMETQSLQGVRRAAELVEVNVGLVSGQNSFFVVDLDTAKRHHIEESCIPIVSRSFQLDGLVLTEDDFSRQLKKQGKMLLFCRKGICLITKRPT